MVSKVLGSSEGKASYWLMDVHDRAGCLWVSPSQGLVNADETS